MKYVGAGVPGLTNRILVTGSGTFTADVQLPGMCTIAILRSPYAHAHITSIDTSRAEAEPGVVAVLTGREIEENTNPVPSAADPGFYGGKSKKIYALPTRHVRYVGEPIAAVVAEDRYTAYHALELIDITYEELPVVFDPRESSSSRAPPWSSPHGATT